jgi:hypothetical protein
MREAESNSGEADTVETGSDGGWVGSGDKVAEQAVITKVKIIRAGSKSRFILSPEVNIVIFFIHLKTRRPIPQFR